MLTCDKWGMRELVTAWHAYLEHPQVREHYTSLSTMLRASLYDPKQDCIFVGGPKDKRRLVVVLVHPSPSTILHELSRRVGLDERNLVLCLRSEAAAASQDFLPMQLPLFPAEAIRGEVPRED